MTSRTSFFNPALFRKNLNRFAPLWGIFLGALLVSGPLALMTRLSETTDVAFVTRRLLVESQLKALGGVYCIFGIIYAVLCAAAVFGYLHNARSAYMMHAFPMTRDCHFVTNTASGLAFALLPHLASALLIILVLGVNGLGALTGQVFLLLAKAMLQYLCFFGMAVFCMHLTGSTVIGVLSYGAMSFIGWALPTLILSSVVEPLFYGFYQSVLSFTFLSPVIKIMQIESTLASAWLYVYAVLGLLLLAAAWLHYRARHMERVGEAMVFGWAKVVFLILFTAAAGLLLGLAIFLILNGGDIRSTGDVLGFTLCLLVGLFVGYFGAQMMLNRTIRVFGSKKFWLGYAAFALVTVLGIACLSSDVFGLQRRMPEVDQIAYAEVCTMPMSEDDRFVEYSRTDNIVIRDAEGIATVTKLHAAALQERGSEEQQNIDFTDSCEVYIVYHLKNGGKMTRHYTVTSPEAMQYGRQLFSNPEYAAAYYEKNLPKDYYAVYLIDPDGSYYETTATEQEVRAAILRDVEAGRMPVSNNFCYNSGDWTMEIQLNNGPVIGIGIPESASELRSLFTQTDFTDYDYEGK